MSVVPQLKLTPEEFLAGERVAETKHEYVGGEVYAMAGASEPHNLIVGNVIGELQPRLKGHRCRVYPSDMRLQVSETGLFTYPDVMVVCDRPVFLDDRSDTLLNPKVIFEVLSPSTEANDRGWKWAHYRQLDSLVEYLLIAQDVYRIEQFIRQPEGRWLFRDYRGLAESLQLPSLECEVAMADLYYMVELVNEGPAAITAT